MEKISEIVKGIKYIALWDKNKNCYWNPIKEISLKNFNDYFIWDINIDVTDIYLLKENFEILVLKNEEQTTFYLPRPNVQYKVLTMPNNNLMLNIELLIKKNDDIYEKEFTDILHSKSLKAQVDKQKRQGRPTIQWDMIKNEYMGSTPLSAVKEEELINLSTHEILENSEYVLSNAYKTIKLIKGQKIIID